jgi:hypothetical protein
VSVGAGPVAPASARISASSVTERDADIAELMFLCPSLLEEDAEKWLDDVARIKARKQSRGRRVASAPSSTRPDALQRGGRADAAQKGGEQNGS